MLRYPASVPAQQPTLAPLQALISQVPACELFITFTSTIDTNMSQLSAGALQNVSQIANNMLKVFDYLHDNQTQSIPSSQYLLNLSQSAQQIAVNTALAAIVSTGTLGITITVAAQTALSTLNAWDPVQGYQAPSNVGQLATTLMNGVSIP